MAKKARYPLQIYLDHILNEKEEASRELAIAQERLRAEEQKKADLEAELVALEAEHEKWMRDYWQGLRQGALSQFDIESRRNHLEGLASDCRDKKLEILAQERQIQKAAQAVDAAREVFQAKANEVRIHEERKLEWAAEILREENRKEERALGDISTARHVRKHSGG